MNTLEDTATLDRNLVASVIHNCEVSDLTPDMLKSAKMRKFFRVEVTFDGAENPQVVAKGPVSAMRAIESTREWMRTVDRHAADRYLGKRVAGTRMSKGESVKVPAAKNPTARERLLAGALNGGGFSIELPDKGFTITGTFVGYIPVN